jgi:transcriptional regulator with XRE-family HTH domain
MVWLCTGEQLRMARIGVNWTPAQLAARTGISVVTIEHLEKLQGPIEGGSSLSTILALQTALE